ncbi:hypothetical protein VMCG_00925 [Cytospora schulzeri]|uniref:J domain-containing protein n=1 Tax=Cytospora schulzeri TaxID=448051 RepID=A0A423X5X9_9PEZI|nr:hypothetical protein VMCG_00925 [Valsa malicola]
MKFSVLSLGLLALLTPLTAAWSKEDREIFRLRDELAAHEGPDVTFYDFLGVTPSASQDDINKAYRKKSRSLHPDKVKQQLTAERAKAKKEKEKNSKNKKPGVNVAKAPSQSEIKAAINAASDRQARLSIVANILKGPGRARYDHFMSNGFPVWKGTNYFYERYRPGLGTVMTGVFIALGGGAHYLALYMGWKRQREFVERYIKFARRAAWGDNLGIPNMPANLDVGAGTPAPPPAPEEQQEQQERAMPTNRKMRRMQEREAKREASQDGSSSSRRASRRAAPRAAPAASSGAATPTPAAGGPQGAKKRIVAENGKVLVVDSLGDVYLEQEDEEGNMEEFLLDPNEIHKPTVSDTALVRMPVWFYGRTIGRLLSKKNNDGGDEDYDEIEEEQAGSDFKDIAADTDSSSGAGGKRTPNTDDDDFELLDKSVEDVSGGGGAAAAKATGSSSQSQAKAGKSNKRKNKRK